MGRGGGKHHRFHCGSDDDERDHHGAAAGSPRKPCAGERPSAAAGAGAGSPAAAAAKHAVAPAAAHVGVALTPAQVAAATSGKRAKLIGTGGFGKVYAADIPGLGRAAIKVAAPGGERALAAEAVHLRRASGHPAIVRALGSCWAPGCAALALQHLPGGALDDRIALGEASTGGGSSAAKAPRRPAPLGWRQRVRVAYQVAAALAHLHGALGIVHCDVKPGNVLLDGDGNAHLSDFGVARPLGEGRANGGSGDGGGAAEARAQPAAAHAPQHQHQHPNPHPQQHHGSGAARLATGAGGHGGGGGTAAAHLRALAAGVASGGVSQVHGWCGTRDWLDPLFEQLGQLCDKSDVFSLGVIMAQLLFDSAEPREARRVSVHQVKSGEMHLPECLRDWPRESALAFGALAVRCCNAADRDARPSAAELAAQLRALLLAGGEAGVARLQAGGASFAAAPPAAGTGGGGGAAATATKAAPAIGPAGKGGPGAQAASPAARLPPAAAGRPAAAVASPAAAQAVLRVVGLQLELAPDGSVTGSATLQPPLPPLPGALADPGPEARRVEVAGEWSEEGRLRLKLDAAAVAAAAASVPGGARWQAELSGAYSRGVLEGHWALGGQGAAPSGGSSKQQQAQEKAAYWFVAAVPAPPAAVAGSAPASGSASAAEAAAAALAEGLAAAVGIGATSRCSKDGVMDRSGSLVRAV